LVEGMTIPAIIHNSNFFYISMPVYEDGSIDCWKRIALSNLSNELERGWLVTEIPVGKEVNFHGLGAYKILSAQWEHTQASYIVYVQECVQSMNSKMIGLFSETFEQKQRWKDKRVKWTAKGMPYKYKDNFGYTLADGYSTNLFYLTDNGWQLTVITAYADETFSIDAVQDQFFCLDEIRELFSTGRLSSNPKGRITVLITSFATITAEALYATDSDEKLKEIEDMSVRISGKIGIHERCQKLYYEYLIWPCEENKERLRAAYEAVPEHERIYLGDMDTKDGDYRRILYTDDKREV